MSDSVGGTPELLGMFLGAVFGRRNPYDRLLDLLDRLRDALPGGEWGEDETITAEIDGQVVTVLAQQLDPMSQEEADRLIRDAADEARRRVFEGYTDHVVHARAVPDRGWLFLIVAPDEDAASQVAAILDTTIART